MVVDLPLSSERTCNWMPDLDGIAHSEGDDVILKIARDAKIIRNSRKMTKSMLKDVVFPEKTTILNGKLYTIYGGGDQRI